MSAGLRVAAAALLTLTAGCARAGEGDVRIVRVDRMVAQGRAAEVPQEAVDALALAGIIPEASESGLEAYRSGRVMRAFEPEVEARFTAGDSLERVLAQVRGRMAEAFPEVRWPKIYGVVWPYRQSVITTSDSVMLIGLNHYLGPEAEAYRSFDPYTRRQKRAELLPAQVAEALLMRAYPAPEGATAREAMLHDGAVAQALLDVVPGLSESLAGGWTAEETDWFHAHEQELMSEVAELDSVSDPAVIAMLLAPGPATPALKIHAPGRAGRYAGLLRIRELMRRRPGLGEPGAPLRGVSAGEIK